MYVLLTFDGITLPRANADLEISTADSALALIPVRSGVLDLDGDERARANYPYRIVVRAELVGHALNDLRAALDALRAKRGVRGVLTRAGLNDPTATQWTYARLQQVVQRRAPQHVYWHQIELNFAVLEPWYDMYAVESTPTLTDLGGGNWQFTLSHVVQLPITAVTLDITANTADIVGFRLANVNGESSISYLGTIAAGQVLTLNTGAWTVINNGVEDSANLHFDGSHRIPEWLRILPGGSTFLLQRLDGSGTPSLFVSYYGMYE